MPELMIERVSKQFKNKMAVEQVSLHLGEGVHGLLGANGAGKTTLLRMLSGVLRPTSGEILCNGSDIKDMDGEYRHMLGYLPQNFGYYPNFSARRYLEYLAACKAVPKELVKDKVQEVLRLVGLKGEQKAKLRTFSGGMLRRLGIAQALLNDPEILILDEPTSGLDPKERIRFRNIISAMSKGRTVILSTHIVSDVEFIADRILLMKQGRIVEEGTSLEITKKVEGRVWEYFAAYGEARCLNERFAISNLKNEDGGVSLRIVSNTCPCEGAKPVKPGLEDVYLSYFEEAAENGENMDRRNP